VLITRAKAEYTAGLAEHRAGNLDRARAAFDRAIGLLLRSNMEVKSDARLNRTFEKLVEEIHNLELATVESGDAPSEQRYEAAAIESFAGLTFPVDPKVSERVQAELKTVQFDLPLGRLGTYRVPFYPHVSRMKLIK